VVTVPETPGALALFSTVRYRLLDLELEDDWPTTELDPDEEGLGVLLRLRGRPVSFVIQACAPGQTVLPEALRAQLGAEGVKATLAHRIREELTVPEPPATKTPSLTVAICTRARPHLLEPCLRSVLALRAPEQMDVLVVDNDPEDVVTEELVSGLEGVRHVREPRPGLDIARNRALREATGSFVAFIDDDVVVDRGWLHGLVEALAENPDSGVITGLVLPRELDTRAQIIFERRGGFRRGFRKLRYEGEHQPGNPLYPLGSGIFGAGANMVLRREEALRIGGFDEALDTGPPLPGGGDLDIFARMIRAGLPLVYEPRMLVFHRHRADMAGLRRQYFSWGTGLMAFVTKTYRNDPSTRLRLRGLVIWWLRYELRQTLDNALGSRRGWGSPDLALIELGGGLVGLAGAYDRSRRRVAVARDDDG
jgi:GT2 family glycosyltransferase